MSESEPHYRRRGLLVDVDGEPRVTDECRLAIQTAVSRVNLAMEAKRLSDFIGKLAREFDTVATKAVESEVENAQLKREVERLRESEAKAWDMLTKITATLQISDEAYSNDYGGGNVEEFAIFMAEIEEARAALAARKDTK